MDYESINQFEDAIAGVIADLFVSLTWMPSRIRHLKRKFVRKLLYNPHKHVNAEFMEELYTNAIRNWEDEL